MDIMGLKSEVQPEFIQGGGGDQKKMCCQQNTKYLSEFVQLVFLH